MCTGTPPWIAARDKAIADAKAQQALLTPPPVPDTPDATEGLVRGIKQAQIEAPLGLNGGGSFSSSFLTGPAAQSALTGFRLSDYVKPKPNNATSTGAPLPGSAAALKPGAGTALGSM
jgi:hypothetical protein